MSINWHDSDARESAIAAKWAAAEERLKVAERMARMLRIWQSAQHHMPGSFAADFAEELSGTADVLREWEALK